MDKSLSDVVWTCICITVKSMEPHLPLTCAKLFLLHFDLLNYLKILIERRDLIVSKYV